LDRSTQQILAGEAGRRRIRASQSRSREELPGQRTSSDKGGRLMRALEVAVAAAWLLAGFVTPPTRAQVPATVAPLRTQSGLVAGQVLPSGVKVWLGIPFAQPPTQN